MNNIQLDTSYPVNCLKYQYIYFDKSTTEMPDNSDDKMKTPSFFKTP